MKILLILTLSLLVTNKFLHANPSPTNKNFQLLKSAESLLFLGDSITYGGEYVAFFCLLYTSPSPRD